MRIHIVQPRYPENPSLKQAERSIAWTLSQLKKVSGKTDLVLLPEYSNCPSLDQKPKMLDNWLLRHPSKHFLDSLSQHAGAGNFALAANVLTTENQQRFNRTILLDRSGGHIAHYDKCHLTDSEKNDLHITAGDKPVLASFEGVKFSFATCFDVYFPEFFERLASLQPDLILYLRTPAEECLERIRERDRSEEVGIGLEYLLQLENLHDEWLLNHPKAVVLDGEKRWTTAELLSSVDSRADGN